MEGQTGSWLMDRRQYEANRLYQCGVNVQLAPAGEAFHCKCGFHLDKQTKMYVHIYSCDWVIYRCVPFGK